MTSPQMRCWKCDEWLTEEVMSVAVCVDDEPWKEIYLCLYCNTCDGCGNELPSPPGHYMMPRQTGVCGVRYYADGPDDINKDEPKLLCPGCTTQWDIAAEVAANTMEAKDDDC